MNKLPLEHRVQVIRALVEGCSIRSTVRMTGMAKNTISKLLVEVGKACAEYQHNVMRKLTCQRVQVDEIWSFCEVKERNIPDHRKDEYGIGDVWTWVAIDADTKLVPSFMVGLRDYTTAKAFIEDLASRLANRVQLTSDGLKVYLGVVQEAFGEEIDFAQLIKIYGTDPLDDRKYSPSICLDCIKEPKIGTPDLDHVSTSFVERQNLTMRMRMRRFTRLTNAFSKKLENHEAAIALHFMHYNFARLHQTLRSTPAMKAKVTDHLWTIEEMVMLTETKSRANGGGNFPGQISN